MQTLRAAAVSMNGGLGQPDQALNVIDHWCQKAKEQGAEFVLFPELVVHGHCTPNTAEIAESVPDGPSVRRLEEMAKSHDLWLSAGLSENENDVIYNTQVLVGPTGFAGKQQKIHLSRDEVLFYTGGKALPVFRSAKCRMGTAICYDNLFPEVTRVLALRGAEILLAPHAARMKMWDDTPESEASARQVSYDHYQKLRLRAEENACFVIVADQAGRAGYVDRYPRDHPNQPHHAGGAFIFGPQAERLAESQNREIREEMVVATLEANVLAEARGLPNYTMKTRRPELFGDLLREYVSPVT